MNSKSRLLEAAGPWHCNACGADNSPETSSEACAGCGVVRSPEPPRTSATTTPARRRVAWNWWVNAASWGYALLVLTVLALIRWVGEGWWGVTVLLFVPRWLFLGPVAGLALASGLCRRPSHWMLQAATALVVAGPLMGFSFPLHRLVASKVSGTRVRVMSYNLGGQPIDIPRLLSYLEREQVEVIGFQEAAERHPVLEALVAHGWSVDRSWRVASRYPIVRQFETLEGSSPTFELHDAFLDQIRVRTPEGSEFIMASVHMPTLRPGLYRIIEGDVAGLKRHVAWWRNELVQVVGRLSESDDTPLLVVGDFNMPSDDSSMFALREYLRFGFEDSGWGYGYTRPSATPWFRIDHILASPHWVFSKCWVGPDFGSDHLPLLAEVVLPHRPGKPRPTAPSTR